MENTNKPNSSNPNIIWTTYAHDPLKVLAEEIIEQHAQQLPDLTHITILLSNSQAASRCRQLLLSQIKNQLGLDAMLGPNITTLPDWVNALTHSNNNTKIVSDYARELMLIEALLEYPNLYGQGSPWALATNLLDLFDDLTRSRVSMPENISQFTQLVSHAYGGQSPPFDALDKESTLVHTLWHALNEELKAHNLTDRHTAYAAKLAATIDTLSNNQAIYLVGRFDFSQAEFEWLKTILKKHDTKIIAQGPKPERLDKTSESSNPKSIPHLNINARLESITENIPHKNLNLAEDNYQNQFFNTLYNNESNLLIKRASDFSKQNPQSPIDSQLTVYLASNAENEAKAVDLQTRRWILEGKTRIGIITENRRLARRVRSLLERANIFLHDSAGWALSTTSAATIVERWLQVIETDFHYQPLLDLLKSPFIFPHKERDKLLTIVYRFEQGIIGHENIAEGLNRYRANIKYRLRRLSNDKAAYYDGMEELLNDLEASAKPLLELIDDKPHSPIDFLDGLQTSLCLLGVEDSMQTDDAGQRILEELQLMQQATHHTKLKLTWVQFRAWLGRALERYNFCPPTSQSHVYLLSLQQSDLMQFDALIIAGAEREFLPGAGNYSPFFNNAVRAKLNIPTRQDKQAEQFHYFRCLLESTHAGTNVDNSSANLLITARLAENGEEIIRSPWLEAIQSFHKLTYGNELIDQELTQLLNDPATQITHKEMPVASPTPKNPSTSVETQLIPKTLSAAAYQQLLDCPFQFFAARCLKLSPPDVIREMLEQSDYGQRVHRCLQAFHSEVAGLAGPFKEKINSDNRESAEEMLVEISQQVFSQDIEDNFMHRGWLQSWLNLIPHYLDWQEKQARSWNISSVESKQVNSRLSPLFEINGRIDRIDSDDNSDVIIDYKTGHTPHKDNIISGESIQLPFYALLADTVAESNKPISRVEYLKLKANEFGPQAGLDEAELKILVAQLGERITHIMEGIHGNIPLPAWGDIKTCQYCNMEGLCRRESWSE